MIEAKFYKKLKNKKVACNACYRNCIIKENEHGFCFVRKNINGSLYSLVYDKPVSINIDPIEKKPIYHYLPKTNTLSLGTYGCNFDCDFCQNHEIAKIESIEKINKIKKINAKEIIDLAKKYKCQSISYTYTEPTIFVEYALEIMKLAHKNGLKNIWVSNGYMQPGVFKEIINYIDCINIDLKGDKEFYYNLVNKTYDSHVKKNIQKFFKKTHVEVTQLLINGYNDSDKQITDFVKFIKSISEDIPVHFSRAYGCYKLKKIIPTKLSTLEKAKKIAIENGLKHVYLGNI